MLSIMTITMFSVIMIYVGSKLFYWFMVWMLAVINSNAVYDEISKHTIFELAKEDKFWKDVAKILGLEKNNEIH